MNHAATDEQDTYGVVPIVSSYDVTRIPYRRRASVVVAIIIGGLVASLLQGCAGPTHPPRPVCDNCRIVCGECEGQDRFVRLQGSVSGVGQDRPPNFSHPATLRSEDWTIILNSLRVQRQGEPILVLSLPKGPISDAFTQDEIEYLSRTLSHAFALAQPTEWVVFGLSRSRAPEVSELTTGGWFIDGSDLHLFLANYRFAVTAPSIRELVWENPLSPQVNLYELVPGAHQTVIHVQEGGLLRTAADELAIAYQPLLLGEPVSTVTPPDSAASSLLPPLPSAPRSFDERLKALKQLRDQGVITEDEYRSKRSQMLERF